MTFLDIEQSKDLGAPYELYDFQYGPNAEDVYQYTNAASPIPEHPAYTPIPIRRDAYKTSGKSERDQLNITVPVQTDIATMILPYPPPYVVEVTIRAGHFGAAGNTLVVWVGRLLSNAFNDGQVILTCESTLVSLKRLGVRRRWQIGCPLVLYSQGVGQCNANQDDFTVEAEVLSVDADGNPVLAEGWEGPWSRSQFKTGLIKWTSQYGVEYRSIRDTQPDRIIFNGPLRGIEVGDTVQLILGCNRKRHDCEVIFDNINNYGGDDWMPLQNPVKHPNFW